MLISGRYAAAHTLGCKYVGAAGGVGGKAEVAANFAAFQKMLPELMQAHRGQYAFMRDGNSCSYD